MTPTGDHRAQSFARERIALALLAGFAIACMIAAVLITSQVLGRIGQYGTARDDNLQWTISQIEVDQFRFRLALADLAPGAEDAPAAVRRRFDLLYSRATTLRTAPAYRVVLGQSQLRDEVARVMALLDEMLPVIDSTDRDLIAGRDLLATQAMRMTPPIRRIAAEALAIDARRSDGERRQLTAQIVTLTGLSTMMFIALFLSLVVMWRLYRGRMAAEAAMAAARDEMLTAEQARARFLGMTSHEMRTPLSGLLGALDLLEDSDLDDEQRRHARIMRLSGEALRTHIDEALGGLDPRADAPVLRPAPFDADALLADLVAGQTIPAEARGNALRLDPPAPRLGLRQGDARRLEQVLLNLVANAIKFTRDGSITLSARPGPGDEVVFAVRDTGIGIAEAAQPAIFEDFIRLPATAEAEGAPGGAPEGTGLGLGIARRIVTAMGGRIGLESRPGAGSTFTVRVPLPPADAAAAPGPATGAAPLPAPLRVLLVEDTPASRTVTEALLERDGHAVTLAEDGLEGVRAARDAPFDLILMDVDMPRLDGIEATRRIRAGDGPNAGTRIVALTAYDGAGTVARLTEAGVDAIEVKPLSRAALRALVAGGPQVRDLVDAAHVAQMHAVLPAPRLAATLAALEREAGALLDMLDRPPSAAPADLRHHVHRLAGSAGACGARALQERLARIEAALDAGEAAHARALCEGLGGLWQRTRAALARAGADA
jgi:signal transduction histidine kinase/DNA-binding NarL/FixJ family response regulator